MRFPVILAGLLLLAACNPTPTGSTPGTKASSSPDAKSSSAPVTADAEGKATVSLKIDGKEASIDSSFKFTPTDLIGKRMRLSALVGKESPSQAGEANVSFLFGAGGDTMVPGWDVERKDGVFTMQVFYVNPTTNAGTGYNLTTNTTKQVKVTREAKDNHIKGHYEVEAFPIGGSLSSQEVPRVPVVLDFDLTQPAFKPAF